MIHAQVVINHDWINFFLILKKIPENLRLVLS